jgi:hypothetical protein
MTHDTRVDATRRVASVILSELGAGRSSGVEAKDLALAILHATSLAPKFLVRSSLFL